LIVNTEIKGYSKLTHDQKELLTMVHTRHLASMGADAKKNYTSSYIKEVKWDKNKNCLKVYYKNGDWWHYDCRGQWW
jgi:hypothetical protein